MTTIVNFSAGPAMLPAEVMQQAQREFLDWSGSGMSVMEISHRSTEFTAIANSAEQDLRELMMIPENYQVLFLHGGARSQFSMVPMNLLGTSETAAYVCSGAWGKYAIDEAKKYCKVNVVSNTLQESLSCVAPQSSWGDYSGDAYVYTVDNETISGVEFGYTPDTGNTPLVSDMSSNLLSRQFDVSKYGLIFACAQKNLGPAGVTIVIIRDDLLARGMFPGTPSMFNYKIHAEKRSMFNTSPTYPWYMVGLVLKWVKSQGGVSVIEKRNRVKSDRLYEFIDNHDFYSNAVHPESRSRMNVVFRLADESLEARFIREAKDAGLVNLRGHRSVGGLRASLYNAMPEEGISRLIAFMREFARVSA